jgi:hypothetical protein
MMRGVQRTVFDRALRLILLQAIACFGGAGALRAANITWSSTDFNVGNLNLGGTVVQAINFGTTSQTVTIGGSTATFVASSTLSPPHLGFPSANDTAAGAPTYTNVVGNQPLINVLMAHAFNGPEDVQSLTIPGLITGQMYELQAFMSDTRTTGTPTLNAAPFHLSDGNGNDSPGATRGSGTILVGTFTANATTQDVIVVSDPVGTATADPALSGLVLRALTGGTVNATLDRGTGQLTIKNNTAGALDILGYSVTSAVGALSQTSWLTVANNYDKPSAPTPGNGSIDANDAWNVLSSASSHTDLSESELAGGNGGAIAAGATFNLGNVWIKNPAEDVAVKLLRGDGSPFPVPVAFTGNGGASFASGDLNFNGSIDAADWTVYISNALTNLSSLSRAEAYQKGDLNGDGVNNLNDLDLFKEAFDAANGVGAFAAMVASVPEPAAGALLLACGIALMGRRRVRRGSTQVYAIVAAALAMLAPASSAVAQITYNPIPTTGFDADVVVEAGLSDGQPGANNEFGSRQFYEEGISTQIPGTHKPGLTETLSGVVSELTGNTINFGFAPFEDNNILKFDNASTSKTLTLASPKAYSNLAIVFSGGSLSLPDRELGQLSFTINYDGGATQTGMILAPDWGVYPREELPEGVDVLVNAGRLNAGGDGMNPWPINPDGETTPDRWRLYVSEFAMTNPTTNILSVDFHTPMLQRVVAGETVPLNGGDDIAVFGIAGPGELVLTSLNLEVNATNGQVRITNPTEIDFEIDGYEIISAAGSLSTAGWTVPTGWDKGGGSSSTGLIAGSLLESAMLGPGAALSLGTAYAGGTNMSNQDLAFRYRRTNGTLASGTVEYITGGNLPGDFDGDGDVDGADLTTLRANFGSKTATSMTGDADGDADADGNDFLIWQRNKTAPVATAAGAAVPEPSGLALAVLGLMASAGLWGRRRHGAGPAMKIARHGASILSLVVCFTWCGSAGAAVTIDREYRFGDDPAELPSAVFGGAVGGAPGGTTYDSAGVPGTGTLQDLLPGGVPTYVNVGPTGLNRPGAAANARGIQFGGVTDYLFGERLGYPGTSDSSTGGGAGGTLDYFGLYNRGFQLWVRPDAASNNRLQDLVLDSNQHGVRISATGTWMHHYNGGDVTTAVPVAFDAWSHVMVVRPYGIVAPNGGSILYVNGVAIAATAGSYNAGDDLKLVIGADTGDGAGNAIGSANFFQGVVDEMTMFVMGKTPSGLDRGAFNFGADNAFAAQPAAMGGLTSLAGDVNQDNAVNNLDVTDFLAGWLKEKRVNNVRVGDITTIRDGDLNFDGITDLSDAFILHGALIAATGAGFDFSLLPVPEPATAGMAAFLMGASAAGRRRRLLRSPPLDGEKGVMAEGTRADSV